MKIESIWKNTKSLNAATGLTLEEGEELLKDFSDERKASKSNSKGPGGRPEALEDRDIFTMTMIHYRHYLNLEMLALMFDVSSSTVKRLVEGSEALLRQVLAKKNFSHLIAPDRKKKLGKSLSENGKFISMALNNL